MVSLAFQWPKLSGIGLGAIGSLLQRSCRDCGDLWFPADALRSDQMSGRASEPIAASSMAWYGVTRLLHFTGVEAGSIQLPFSVTNVCSTIGIE